MFAFEATIMCSKENKAIRCKTGSENYIIKVINRFSSC